MCFDFSFFKSVWLSGLWLCGKTVDDYTHLLYVLCVGFFLEPYYDRFIA